MDSISGKSASLAQENLNKLLELFPSCVLEVPRATSADHAATQDHDAATAFASAGYTRRVDVAKLLALIGEEPDSTSTAQPFEPFGFLWAGKRQAIAEAAQSIDKTLRPAVNESVDFAHTRNLYIEGDNLEALKLLLRGYSGAVKMIYIDPPYNTGTDFVYKDDFRQGQREYEQAAGIADSEGKRFVVNKSTEARFHSNWCSMMYARLALARQFLTKEGVIFISIDDHEQHHLRCLCDEVFGEHNFVAQLIWQRAYSPKNDAKYVSNSHDYVLLYARNIDSFDIGRLPRDEKVNAVYKNMDNDPRGVWRPDNLSVKTYSAANDYPITTPSGKVFTPPTGRCWSVSQQKFQELVSDNRIWFGRDGNSKPSLKRFLHELNNDGMVPTSLLLNSNIDDKSAQAELNAAISANLQAPQAQALLANLKEKTRFAAKSLQAKLQDFLDQALADSSEANDSSAIAANTLLLRQQIGDSQEGAQELKALMHAGVFDGPKPVRLISHLMRLANLDKDDIVLDFFSGSATTAEAVLRANAADGGSRRFILVQFPEPCAPNSPAAQAGFTNICEIGKERIRKVIAALKSEQQNNCTKIVHGGSETAILSGLSHITDPLTDAVAPQESVITPLPDASASVPASTAALVPPLDLGFRVFKIDSSNKNPSYPVSEYQQALLSQLDSAFKADRSELDLFFGCLLDYRLPLDRTFATIDLAGHNAYVYDHGELLACFADDIDVSLVEAIAALPEPPIRVVLNERCFSSSEQQINLSERFKTLLPQVEIKVL